MFNTKNYQIKNLKSFMGREGHGFNCSLYEGNKKIASVINSADGGEYDYHWDDKIAEKVLVDYVGTFPEMEYEGLSFFPTLDIFVEELVENFEQEKWMKNLLKNNWVYKFKDKQGLMTFKKTQNKVLIEMKYADQIIECLNK